MNKIKNRRKELKLTQLEVAEKVGVTRATISMWENDVTAPTGVNLIQLASALESKPSWLSELSGSMAEIASVKTLGVIPLITMKEAAKWQTSKEISNKENYPCPIPCSDNAFVVQVMGDAMSPEYNAGDLLFIDPEVTAENGKDVIISDGEDAVLRRYSSELGKKRLISINSDYDDIDMPDNCFIVGTVIMSAKVR